MATVSVCMYQGNVQMGKVTPYSKSVIVLARPSAHAYCRDPAANFTQHILELRQLEMNPERMIEDKAGESDAWYRHRYLRKHSKIETQRSLGHESICDTTHT